MTSRPVIGRVAPQSALVPEAAGSRQVPPRIELRTAPAAWVLVVLSVALSVTGLALLWGNDVAWLHGHPDDAINGIVYPVVGALILSRRRHHPIGWLFVAIGLPMGLAIASAQYALTGMAGAEVADWIGRWVWLLGVPVIPTVVVLLFPDGRLPSRRWRPVLWAGVAGIALLLPAIALLPEQDPTAAANPLAVTTLEAPLTVVGYAGFALLGIGSLGGLASVMARYRSAGRIGRLQLRWFLAAAVTVVFAVVLGNSVPIIGPAVQLVAFPLIALATAAAILRYRLYDIDAVISTSLVWGGLTACVLGGYVALIALVGGLFPRGSSTWPALIAAAAVAVVFQPLRIRLQAGVDRLMYGDRNDPARGLRRLGARLEDTIALDTVLPTVVTAVAEALRVPAVEIELHYDDRWVEAARHGSPVGTPLQLPLVFRGETVGRLRISPREAGAAFSSADRQLLEDLARQAGVAVHAVRVTKALQHSRAQLVTALEGERRRIHRDLHDGLGPSLAALSMGLAAARNLRGTNPEEADALLRQLETETTDLVVELRRLVNGLRPPQLDDLGLEGALRERATALSSSHMSVDVASEGPLPDLPAATELAAYRIVNEAVTNAVRHSGGGRCTVRLSADDALVLDVQDDGTGLTSPHRPGSGLRSLADRAAELGGSVQLGPAPIGGTRVLALLPLEVT
jgi:two-component system, NarL family, sensor kinase